MRQQGTGGETWPLTSPEEEPTIVAGGSDRFDMNDVPIKAPTGPLANYVPALLITLLGAFINAGESPGAISWIDLPRLLIKSVEVRDVWHGVPVSSAYWLGEHMRIHEFIGSDFKYGQRAGGTIPPLASPGAPIGVVIRVPLSAGGDLERETSQLALCYQPGSVNIEWKDASVLDAYSDGTTFAGTVRCDLELDPRAELVLGTPVEWVLHRQVASANGTEIQIKGFGRSSKLTGVEAKGGVLALMELSSQAGQGGVFDGADVLRYGFDWRGQKPMRSVRALLAAMTDMVDRRPDVNPAGVATAEFSTFPYWNATNLGGGAWNDVLNTALLAWLMVLRGDEARLTDVETADSDQTFQFEVTGGFDTGEHLILAQYAKVWTDGKRADWVAKVKQSGLDKVVLGDAFAAAQLRPRGPTDKHVMTADQMAYLPFQYMPPPTG